MSYPNDAELKKIVDEVVSRMMASPSVTTSPTPKPKPAPQPKTETAGSKVIAIGADHGGYPLKESLKAFLTEKGYQVDDCGTHSSDAVDYPDLAYTVAAKVAGGQAWRGIVIDGAGIGSCMAANKVNGVRAAMCYDHATAFNSREHNNANVLSLGAGLIGSNLARQIATTFLETEFAGGRHARRVDKIMEIES
jgi:ribose 5-phosphate isomerase B